MLLKEWWKGSLEHVLSPIWVLLLLLTGSFALATALQDRVTAWDPQAGSASVLQLLLGDSRKLLAEQFIKEADVSFHSGYYPSIFDEHKAPKETEHMTSTEGSPEAEAHEQKMSFLSPPRDWIERFGRNFLITEHTHLEGGNQREILPWLRISAELDPHRIDTYTVAAYWLRNSLGKVDDAEQFLREGLRNNPASYDLWYELGLLYIENRHDLTRARNAWELSLRYWQKEEPSKAEPDLIGYERIVVHLADLAERTGNLERAIQYYEMVLKTSPNPEVVREQIVNLEQKLTAPHQTNSTAAAKP
jgi:tetratricopeptide (TPR) repeat protein